MALSDRDVMNFRLIFPFKLRCIAPSGGGKSFLVRKIIEQRKEIIDKPIDRVIYFFTQWQSIFDEMKAADPNIIFTDRIEDVDALVENPCIIIFDDCLQSLNKGNPIYDVVTRYFLRSAHHLGCCVCLLLQIAFGPGLRILNLNSDYVAYFQNRRDSSSFQCLARQVGGGQTRFLLDAYKRSTENKPFSYLFCDFHPRNK